MDTVEIYTDGACSGNPGPGGWAAILKYAGHEKEIAGHATATTNNRMELTAVIEALKRLKRPCRVIIYSDSSYLIDSFTKGWLANWRHNGWKRGPHKRDPVPNADLWQQLDQLVNQHEVTWRKVRGHAGHAFNERVDRLAVQQIERLRSQTEGGVA
ncbi:MAG: ribonuclease HI [candidate division KSB1 bacterium]|nr:ribonuclease HI [candidate division KSB1 bacterium]MDZ7273505.1 ribonuclease HI [candidate division KSB1 bacterium]MDZ7286904.1 ribonuclease HI [candidate division KSB1 bacterium]MDZ7299743.1 ribonuclease HI [candidate division KSB1 bacterium]MDZ7305682.1 ribonuclease HI [candidate division KSB1 bacterium]